MYPLVRDLAADDRRSRFYWRGEEQADREAMAKTVSTLDLVSLVAVATAVAARRPDGPDTCA